MILTLFPLKVLNRRPSLLEPLVKINPINTTAETDKGLEFWKPADQRGGNFRGTTAEYDLGIPANG